MGTIRDALYAGLTPKDSARAASQSNGADKAMDNGSQRCDQTPCASVSGDFR
jgi:hypothetical protein